MELKAVAETLMDLRIQAVPSASLPDRPLAQQPLESLAALPTAELAQSVDLTLSQAKQLQRDLRKLQLLLKNDVLGELRLSDLTTRAS
jgi:hypothetical protein